MNNLIEIQNVVSMTTLEIAELTGKRHDHVMRDTRKMYKELTAPQSGLVGEELTAPRGGVSEETYIDSTGRQLPMFRLDKKHTLILVTGYSVKLRAAIIERIEFLESQVKRLEDTQKRAAVQSANRRGVTWGDYCKTHGLPAQRLKKAVLMARNLFKIRPDGRVEINPKYKEFFIVLKPTDRRFSSNGINFRFNAKGLERFSTDKAVDKFRTMLIEQLGSDYEKSMLLASRAKAEGYDPTTI